MQHAEKTIKQNGSRLVETDTIRLVEKKQQVDTEASASICNEPKQRRSLTPSAISEYKCFFCDQSGDPGELHQASTFGLDVEFDQLLLKWVTPHKWYSPP